MLHTLIISLIKDFIVLLVKDRKFLTKDKDQKLKFFHEVLGANYPKSFSHYLTNVSEKDFLMDIAEIMEFLKNNKFNINNLFLDSIVKYVSEDFGYVLDELTNEFFFSSLDKRFNYLSQIFQGSTYFDREIKELIMFGTYQELNEFCFDALNKIKETLLIVVQSPIQINSDTKKEMRKYFLNKYSNSFIEFRINKEIIGGIRIFSNGKIEDHSWMFKIRRLGNVAV
jgi:F0F1-type ATP synthase delta subunit